MEVFIYSVGSFLDDSVLVTSFYLWGTSGQTEGLELVSYLRSCKLGLLLVDTQARVAYLDHRPYS